jgi:hypothetical protein
MVPWITNALSSVVLFDAFSEGVIQDACTVREPG